jgi:nucleotide-binding universal stress UspA family protein
MAYKEILVPVMTLDADETALRVAADLAAKFNARATALIVSVWLGSDFAHVPAPLSEALLDLVKGQRSVAALERKKITAWLERAQAAFEIRDVTAEAALGRDEVVAHARMADLIVAARAATHDRARRELLEEVLFKSGRPVLLLPPRTPVSQKWERVLIAWNAKAEAVRAVTAALVFLHAAKEVRIVTVDAAPSGTGHGEAPGRELAAYLARHGVRVEVSNLDGLGREHAKAIADAAMDFGADVIVMGAYGHSRAREFVLGGVTRDLLDASKTALLLAH